MLKPVLLSLLAIWCIFLNVHAQSTPDPKTIISTFSPLHNHGIKKNETSSPAFLQTGLPHAYEFKRSTPNNKFKTFAPNQCYDTSVRLIYKNDTIWTYNDFITQTKDG